MYLIQDVCDSNDMTQIRSMTGVCPQHNILFDDLSCEEHVEFYGALKGVTDQQMDTQVGD